MRQICVKEKKDTINLMKTIRQKHVLFNSFASWLVMKLWESYAAQMRFDNAS